MNTKKNRQHPRYYLFWRIALLFDEAGERVIFHGKTCDLSLYGAAMHVNHNIACQGPLVILLAPPPLSTLECPRYIEIKAHIVYSVYSSSGMCFRIGLQFDDFVDNGRAILKQRLKYHSAALEVRSDSSADGTQ